MDEQTEIPTFDHYPSLHELIGHTGTPGISYLLGSPMDLIALQKDGWTLIPRQIGLEIKGPKDSTGAVLYQKGSPIPNAAVGALFSPYFIHRNLDTLTGLGETQEPTHGKAKVQGKDRNEGVQQGTAA